MKKIIIIVASLVVVVGLAIGLTQHQARPKEASQTITPGTLTIGLEGTFAPFSYRQNGQLTGFEVDLSTAIAKKLGLKPKYVQTKWDSLIAGLGAKRYDVVFNDVGITPERQKAYLFATPYLYAKTVLIKRTDETHLNTLADLKGKKMAQSTTSNFGALAKKSGADIVAVPGMTEAMNLVTTKRADGALNDLGAYATWKKANPEAAITAVDLSQESPATPAAPLLNKQNTALQKAINNALKDLEADGTLKKLSLKYFNTDLTQP
ncbi:MAG: transporter substrate-binding domain-containing protein [Leuconostoc lactis]|uniref:transporter substrate-binding domain-containing protein n=1 Tax=Leuconostoc lactis TaxID=1246 RepID=UPI00399402C6